VHIRRGVPLVCEKVFAVFMRHRFADEFINLHRIVLVNEPTAQSALDNVRYLHAQNVRNLLVLPNVARLFWSVPGGIHIHDRHIGPILDHHLLGANALIQLTRPTGIEPVFPP